MNDVFAPPTPTAFDAITTALAAAAYLVVALAAFARAPRDVRALVFLAVAALNLGPAGGTIALWREGTHAAYTPELVAMLSITTLAGSLALFHFTQVFPWRRPWIARHGIWIFLSYFVVTAVPLGMLALLPKSVEQITVVWGLMAMAVALPLIGLYGVVVPLAGLASLYRSCVEAKAAGRPGHARAAFWMLVSQVGGGILAAILLPLLHMTALPVAWTTAASALLFAFGILMPLAYAAAVWKLRLLDASNAA
jgi:hypothetical protein